MVNKENVFEVYDQIYDFFDKYRTRELTEKHYLDQIIKQIKPGGSVLDLGCGMGEPIARYFIDQGFKVTGIEPSHELIKMAKERIPEAKLVKEDMRLIDLKERFDCIIAWDSFFHLQKQDQRHMFVKFQQHINFKGFVLFTSGPDDGETWDNDNGGHQLYHASLSAQEYKKLFAEYGFDVLIHNIQDKVCDRTVWLAQYKSE